MKQNQFEFKPFDKVLVRDYNDDPWRANFYSNFNEKENAHICADSYWQQCIPYNKNTAHLIGTCEPYEEPTKEPKEHDVEFKPFDRVLRRDNDDERWQTDYYSRRTTNGHRCLDFVYKQCIPYNEETKHLRGTTLPYEKPVKEPKEYHVWTSGTFNQWFTKTEFENFIKTEVINNKDITDFHVLYVKHNN